MRSITHHVANKYGVDMKRIHETLEDAGFNMIDMFRRAVHGDDQILSSAKSWMTNKLGRQLSEEEEGGDVKESKEAR